MIVPHRIAGVGRIVSRKHPLPDSPTTKKLPSQWANSVSVPHQKSKSSNSLDPFAYAGPMFHQNISIRVGITLERDGFVFTDLEAGQQGL